MVTLEGSGVFLLCLQGILAGAGLFLQLHVPGYVPLEHGGLAGTALLPPGTALLLLQGQLCCADPVGFWFPVSQMGPFKALCWHPEPVGDAVLLLFVVLSLLSPLV